MAETDNVSPGEVESGLVRTLSTGGLTQLEKLQLLWGPEPRH